MSNSTVARRRYRTFLGILIGITACGPSARAQAPNPVYVDNSPRAAELLHLARTHAKENAGEAVRLYQELLDEYGRKLVPWRENVPDHFTDVRGIVIQDLLARSELRDRYAVAEEGEAARLLEAGEIERLVATRSLTGPGRVALLRLAQESVESARFEAALSLLSEILAQPSLPDENLAAAWLMVGTSAHYLGRAERGAEAQRQLKQLPRFAAHNDELDRIVAGGRGPDRARGVTPLDVTEASEQQELVAQEIWFEPLPNSLLHRRFPERPGAPRSPGFDANNRRAYLTTAAPTTAGAAVYVNEGLVVRALDRYTGRSLWPQEYRARNAGPVADRDADATGDLNLITIEGDWLVTLTGHAQDRLRTDDGKVLCLSTTTGKREWQLSLHRLGGDEEYAQLFPHGQPLIIEGRVIVLARKISRQSVTGCYAVALDLATGNVDWIRHIASSGGRHRTGRPFASPRRDRGDLLVSTAVGAVACLDVRSGAIRWLRRDPVPVHVAARQRRPWELRTLVTGSDVVIALSPDDKRVLVFDRDSGATVTTHEASSNAGWAQPAYLLGSDTMVYGIGASIRAFHRDALDLPAWQIPAPPQSESDEPVLMTDDLRIAGRVQLAGDLLIVPTERAVLAVDARSGQVVHELDVGKGGNPVAADGQLLLASGDELDAYMSFSRAVTMLRERMTVDGTDPEPALSLVQLATRVDDFELVMEGARLALDAIDRPENRDDVSRRVDARQELFRILLSPETVRLAAAEDEGEALHALVAVVASSAAEQVEHLLAYADWLAERRPPAAAEPLHRILTDPVLRSTVRAELGGVVLRPTEAWVCERLRRLIAAHGAPVYAPIADMGRSRLNELVSSPDGDEALMQIAMDFPLARAGIDAALLAAEEARRRGQPRQGLARLLLAFQLAPSADRASTLLGRFVSSCVADDRFDAARSALDEIIARHGDLQLQTPAGRRRAKEWRDTLAVRRQRPARLGVRVGEGVDVVGEIVPVVEGGHLPPDVAMLRDGTSVRLVQGTRELWNTIVDHGDPRILDADDRFILLWIDDDPSDPRVVALDRRTGAEAWSTPFLGDHLDPPLAQERPIGERMPNGDTFTPKQTLCRISGDGAGGGNGLFLVQRTGGIAAFSRHDGRILLWSLDRTLDHVYHAVAHPLGVVLVGATARPRGADGTPELEPRIVVLDPADGRVLHQLRPNTSSGVIWVTIDGLGGLACASSEGIELIDIVTGARRWTNVAYQIGETNNGWAIGGDLLVETRTSALATLDDATGRLSGPFDISPRGDWDPLKVEGVTQSGERLLVRYRERIVRYDHDGNVQGADVVEDDRDYRWLIPAEQGFVAISLHDTTQTSERRRDRTTKRTYKVYRLSDSCRVERPPLEIGPLRTRISGVRLIDGWILLSTLDGTIALPMPPG